MLRQMQELFEFFGPHVDIAGGRSEPLQGLA